MERALDEAASKARWRYYESNPERRAAAAEWLAFKPDQKLVILLDRRKLSALCTLIGAAVPFSMVQSDELGEIALSRLARLRGVDPLSAPPDTVPALSGILTKPGTPAAQAFDACLFGLAFSGGGIRSATFSLGLLQGMAERDILPWVDILSTVSGGGYIGSWLIAWIKRRGSVASVQESLRGSDPHSDHMRPIRLLRDYSRYLAPRSGMFSPDSWTVVNIWLRNAALNMVILLLLFGALLLAPRILIYIWQVFLAALILAYPNPALLLASAPLVWACWRIGYRNLSTFGPYRRPPDERGRGDGDAWISKHLIVWIVLGAFSEAIVLWTLARDGVRPARPVGMISFCLGVGILVLFGSSRIHGQNWDGSATLARRVTIPAVVMAFCMGCCYALLHALYTFQGIAGLRGDWAVWAVGAAGAFVIAVVTAVIFTLFIGLYGRDLSDEQREWWGRLGAWIGIATVGWLGLCLIAFFAPVLIALSGSKILAAGTAVGWGTVTAAGLKWAYSASSGHNGGVAGQSRIRNLVLAVAPVFFTVGLLSAVSYGLVWAVALFPGFSQRGESVLQVLCCEVLEVWFPDTWAMYGYLMAPSSAAAPLLCGIFLILCLAFAWRVDVNEFSLHNFYRNRLVRAYLGASRMRAHRYPNAFTGFDLEDDIRLRRFQVADTSQKRDMARDNQQSYCGPFPVINTALNITKGADLGVQQRQAESFVFTPLWSGFDFSRRQAAIAKSNLSEYGFRRTERFGDPDNGAMLGTAVAISGAAVNANSGFHTSPPLAFLLTVFGARLGWWAGNPRRQQWTSPSPRFGLLYLVKELTGSSGTEQPFVMLSDGGHFENMGLYELIRRRCRCIVLSDAEEDKEFKLEGIGGAIRKCRIDFGVAIDLNLEALQPLGDAAKSRLHYSLGTVTYPGQKEPGKLVYIKASVTGDEPVDVVEFGKRHDEFPHTSTANQFFDEAHFESYRALGHHTAKEVFTGEMPALPLGTRDTPREFLEDMFERIEREWQKKMAAPVTRV